MIKVDLKGNVKELEAGVTAAEVAKSIGMGLYKSACAARIDGEVCDLRTPLRSGASDAELLALLRNTIREKPLEHHFGETGIPATRGMYRIGG